MTCLFIDADACPVRAEAIRVAERHGISVYLVSNSGMRPGESRLVHNVMVEGGPDAADKWIAEHIAPDDICVTGDIPLAARCIDKGAAAIRHDGRVWTEASIGQALAMRDLMADIRAANPLAQGGGGKPFGRRERSGFLQALEVLVRRDRGSRGGLSDNHET